MRRKFEANFGLGERRCCSRAGCFGHFLALGSQGLQFFQFGKVLLVITAETKLLNAEIVDLFLMRDEGMSLNESFPYGRLFLRKHIFEVEPAERIDAHLQSWNAIHAPLGIG